LIVYLHGFNSSAQSHKALVLGRFLQEQGLGAQYACPDLPMPLAADDPRNREAPVPRELPCRFPARRLLRDLT
jgi:hypothetical protein